jgi:hypothetical protein
MIDGVRDMRSVARPGSTVVLAVTLAAVVAAAAAAVGGCSASHPDQGGPSAGRAAGAAPAIAPSPGPADSGSTGTTTAGSTHTTAPTHTTAAHPSTTHTSTTHTGTTPHTTATKHAADKPPRVISVTISPADIEPMPCGPSVVRPEVTARVSDPDDATSTLVVHLTYGTIGSYEGEVRMKYDASLDAFTYELPPVQGGDTRQGGDILASITVQDPSGLEPRPSAGGAITVVDDCGPTITNT